MPKQISPDKLFVSGKSESAFEACREPVNGNVGPRAILL
jgi:hypothetical protein